MKIASSTKRRRPFHIYQMSTLKDFFFNHPDTVLLGFLGTVAGILLLLLLGLWIADKIW